MRPTGAEDQKRRVRSWGAAYSSRSPHPSARYAGRRSSTNGRRQTSDGHPPRPSQGSVVDLISAPGTFARHRGWWSLRPFPRAGRQWKPDCGEFVVRGVAVDAIPLGIRPHGGPGSGANPLSRGVRAGRLAHSMAARRSGYDVTGTSARWGPIMSASRCPTPIRGPLPRDIWWRTFQPAFAVRQLGMRLQARDGLSVPEKVDG